MLGRLERFWTVAVCFSYCRLLSFSMFSRSLSLDISIWITIAHHQAVNRLLRSTLYDDRAYFAIFHLASLLPRINFECISFFSFWLVCCFIFIPLKLVCLLARLLARSLTYHPVRVGWKWFLSMFLLRLLVVSCLFYSIYYEDELECVLCVCMCMSVSQKSTCSAREKKKMSNQKWEKKLNEKKTMRSISWCCRSHCCLSKKKTIFQKNSITWTRNSLTKKITLNCLLKLFACYLSYHSCLHTICIKWKFTKIQRRKKTIKISIKSLK